MLLNEYVICKSREECLILEKILYDNDYKWNSGMSIIRKNIENFSDLSYYLKHGGGVVYMLNANKRFSATSFAYSFKEPKPITLSEFLSIAPELFEYKKIKEL